MQEQENFRKSLIISFLLHLIFIVIFVYGIPSMFHRLPEATNVVVFEMVPLADITNIKTKNTKTLDPKENLKAQKVKKSSTTSVPAEKIEEEKPSPVQKEAEIIPKKQKEEKKPTPKVEKKAAKPPSKKAETLKKKQQQEEEFDSILKNLEKESEGQEAKSLNKSNQAQVDEGQLAMGDYDANAPLSITEKMLIKKQIEDNWQRHSGGGNIQITLHLKMAKDGAVIEAKVTNVHCDLATQEICTIEKNNAERAARKASPIKHLRPERYDIWQEFDLTFDPDEL